MSSPAALADDEYTPGPRTVVVKDNGFKNSTTRVLVHENVTFVLDESAQFKHSVSFGTPPNRTAPSHYELDPSDPDARQITVTFDEPGYHTYRCTFHPHEGVVKVRNP